MVNVSAGVRMNERPWSNAHAELIKSITVLSVDYQSLQYLPVKATDVVMPQSASEYLLRLAAAIRVQDSKSKRLQKLADEESDLRMRDELFVIVDTFEIEIDTLVGLYFLQLHMEFPDWKGAPLFTIRDHSTVVVTQESIRKLKGRLTHPYNSNERALYFRQLALSPILHVKH